MPSLSTPARHVVKVDATEREVDSVVIYDQRAQITRNFTVELEAGQNEVEITKLPTCLDETSLRVDSLANAVVFDVVYERMRQTSSAAPDESPHLLDLKDQEEQLWREYEVIRSQDKVLTGFSESLSDKELTPAQLDDFLRMLGTRRGEYMKSSKQLEKRLSTVRYDMAKERRGGQTDEQWKNRAAKVTVVVWADVAGPVELSLTYVVSNARWTPLYDLRATVEPSGKAATAVSLSYRASITQTTGEDWNNVDLVLSTSSPLIGAQIPQLYPQKIGAPYSGFAEYPAAAQQRAALYAQRQAHGTEAIPWPAIPSTVPGGLPILAGPYGHPLNSFGQPLQMPRAGAAAPIMPPGPIPPIGLGGAPTPLYVPLAGGSQETVAGDEKSERAASFPPATVPTAIAKEGAISASFHIEGRSSIPSDSSTHKVSIAVLNLSAELERIAVPQQNPSAFLQCQVTNTSPYVMLEGPANVFLDGSFVSRSIIPHVSPQEHFACSVGVDSAVRIEYHPRSKKGRTSGSVFSSKSEATLFSQRITVKNTRQTHIKLIVRDQVPVSEDEKFKVTVLEPKELATAPVGRKVAVSPGVVSYWARKDWDTSHSDLNSRTWRPALPDVPDGQVEWLCQLAAGKSCDLLLSWEVSAPVGERWVMR